MITRDGGLAARCACPQVQHGPARHERMPRPHCSALVGKGKRAIEPGVETGIANVRRPFGWAVSVVLSAPGEIRACRGGKPNTQVQEVVVVFGMHQVLIHTKLQQLERVDFAP